MILFLKVPVQRIIPKQVPMSKTQELLIDQEIMEMLDEEAIKKVEYHFPDQYRSLFPSAAVLDLKKVCEICLVGKSLRVSLPLFWIKACSLDIFKAIKVANSSIKTVEHSSSDISCRYSSDGKNIRGNELRNIDFST